MPRPCGREGPRPAAWPPAAPRPVRPGRAIRSGRRQPAPPAARSSRHENTPPAIWQQGQVSDDLGQQRFAQTGPSCAKMPENGNQETEESMSTAQPAIFGEMGEHQWYVHLSRTEGADLNKIKEVLRKLRADCAAQQINLVLGFGPTLLADLTDDMP